MPVQPHRPLNERELADRTPQVITTNEALREVTLFQHGHGAMKQPTSRTFRFDKASVLGAVPPSSRSQCWRSLAGPASCNPWLLLPSCLQVFGCDSHQEKLYKQAIVPIVQEVMEGFNCTIFAYGQVRAVQQHGSR